ncbi:hypothetical protein R50073_29010 [Maricurvus nonylphenolicus]|uniref:DUF2141 domain-containing protein n=1 Tax=Maricurvus nonylphenolicus TaxID=1008307 RepID=UPI0036F1DCC8
MTLKKLLSTTVITCSMLMPVFGQAADLFGDDEEQINLTLEVKGIRSDEGTVMLQLFDSEDAFNDAKGDKAMATYIARASEDGLTVTIHDLKKGVYAVTLIHDENGNGQLDWKGQSPSEGYAYSRGAGKYSLPDFEDASISLLRRSRNISLDLVYH